MNPSYFAIDLCYLSVLMGGSTNRQNTGPGLKVFLWVSVNRLSYQFSSPVTSLCVMLTLFKKT